MRRREQPVLPMEHMTTDGRCYVDDGNVSAHRGAGEPDTIYLGFHTHGGTVTMYLTPAALVHLANELLTDNERAAILAPTIAGAASE